MALRPEQFYDHAVAVADTERRLPLARMTGWDISPFDQDGLRVAPLRPPVLPEPARHGEDPTDCRNCQERDKGIWFNDHWRLDRVPGVGVPLALMLYPRDHYDMADLPDELAAELDTFRGQGLVGVGGDRPVPVKKPSISVGRYCMRLSRFLTAAARSVAVRTARFARLPFIVDQTFSTGLSSGA